MNGRKSDRTGNFDKLKDHPMIGGWVKQMSQADLAFCRQYLADHAEESDTDFIFGVNRMWLGVEDKPKGWSKISDILSATIDPMVRPRRS